MVAHRAAYEMHYGMTLGGLFACHRCDNRNCVRPDHIFAGTQLDNMRDMANKGRKVTARGFDLPHTRLSINDVLEIIRLCKSGVPNKSIALMYGVDASHVSKIKHGASRAQLV